MDIFGSDRRVDEMKSLCAARVPTLIAGVSRRAVSKKAARRNPQRTPTGHVLWGCCNGSHVSGYCSSHHLHMPLSTDHLLLNGRVSPKRLGLRRPGLCPVRQPSPTNPHGAINAPRPVARQRRPLAQDLRGHRAPNTPDGSILAKTIRQGQGIYRLKKAAI